MIPPLDTQKLCALARGLGLVACGVADASACPEPAGVRSSWLAAGMHGEMAYLERNAALACRPGALAPGAIRVVSVAAGYYHPSIDPVPARWWQRDGTAGPGAGGDAQEHGRIAPVRGRVARYAQGRDYHRVLGTALRQMARWMQEQGARVARPWVDATPLAERAWAVQAGLGWLGRHGNLIVPGYGSWVVLGEILTDLPLDPTPPAPRAAAGPGSRCGRCRRCLEACPTGAIVAPGRVDARRCIAYLTIEKRGAIPEEWRSAVGGHLFGCDVCQEACPFNWRAQPAPQAEPGLAAGSSQGAIWQWHPRALTGPHPAVVSILNQDQEAFRRRFWGTPLARPGLAGLQRNAALVLGNSGRPAALGEVVAALRSPQVDEAVKESLRWAAAQLRRGSAAESGRHPPGPAPAAPPAAAPGTGRRNSAPSAGSPSRN